MSGFAPIRALAARLADLRRDRGGAVAVEFGLTAVILVGFMATIVDLSTMMGISRDVERSSAQIAAMLTSCPSTGSCITTTMNEYYDRKANTLVQYPNAVVNLLQVKKVGGQMLVCIGRPTTFLDPAVAAKASPVFAELDSGIIVVVQIPYVAFMPYTSSLMTLTTTTANGTTGPGVVFTAQTSAVRTSTGVESC